MAVLAMLLRSFDASADATPPARSGGRDARGLVCGVGGVLHHVDGEGKVGAALRPPAPVAFTHLAAAGKTLVGVAGDRIYQLRRGAWRVVASLTEGRKDVLSEPRQVNSGKGSAMVVLRGDEPGTLGGFVMVEQSGKLRRAVFGPHARPGLTGGSPPSAASCPPPLVAYMEKRAPGAPCELIRDEPTPWGTWLVSARLGSDDDRPGGPLLQIGEGKLTELSYKGQPLDSRGTLQWLSGDILLFDGRYSAAAGGYLLLRRGGQITAIEGAEGPCAAPE